MLFAERAADRGNRIADLQLAGGSERQRDELGIRTAQRCRVDLDQRDVRVRIGADDPRGHFVAVRELHEHPLGARTRVACHDVRVPLAPPGDLQQPVPEARVRLVEPPNPV